MIFDPVLCIGERLDCLRDDDDVVVVNNGGVVAVFDSCPVTCRWRVCERVLGSDRDWLAPAEAEAEAEKGGEAMWDEGEAFGAYGCERRPWASVKTTAILRCALGLSSVGESVS